MHDIHALLPIITLLAAGTGAAFLSRLIKISPIIGYLIAGGLIGPFGFDLIEPHGVITIMAELGVVFLLFEIGMHFSVEEIERSGRDFFAFAPLQMLGCGGLFFMGAVLIGWDGLSALTIGAAIALSSTAVISHVLQEHHSGACPVGRTAKAVLIFQDICAIFLLILATSLGSDRQSLGMEMAQAGIMALIALCITIVCGVFVVKPLFRILADKKYRDSFTGITLLLVLASAVGTGAIGLSMSLGAFLAGLAISNTPYRYIIQTEANPFRNLFLSFFFVSVGVGANLPFLLDTIHFVVLGAIGILLFKTLLTFLAAKISRKNMPEALNLSFLLAQGSEFTLVIISIPAIMAGSLSGMAGLILAATALSLAIAPIWAELGRKAAHWYVSRAPGDLSTTPEESLMDSPVLVYGMTQIGRLVVDALRDNDLPHIAMDSELERFADAKADGYDVLFGNPDKLDLIQTIGATHAKAIVIATPSLEKSKLLTPEIKARFPNMKRYVAVETQQEKTQYSMLDMHAYISVTEPYGIELTSALMHDLGVGETHITAWIIRETQRLGIDNIVISKNDSNASQAA